MDFCLDDYLILLPILNSKICENTFEYQYS